MTNGDKIRAMSDEELVLFLDWLTCRCVECAGREFNKDCPIYRGGKYCKPSDIMAWLQEQAEEDA